MISIFTVGSRAYEEAFAGNGDMVLIPTSCDFVANLNGDWYLEMTHPLDAEERWKWIEEEAVLKVPTWHSSPQLFRISEIRKTNTDVRVLAYPIFYDARNNFFIEDLEARGTLNTVLSTLLRAAPVKEGTATQTPIYSVSSNITTVKKIHVERRNFIDVLNGQEEPTIIGTWGGEILFNNFNLGVYQQIGSDNGVEVRYGKNISGVEYTIDYSEMCTRIYPQAHGGYSLSAGNKWVDSPLINNYGILYVKNMVFDNIRLLEDVGENEDTTNLTVCADRAAMDTALREACQKEFNAGLDKPKVNLSVDLVVLEDTVEYKAYSSLTEIGLGDDVKCLHDKLGVTSTARAVSITWDCLKNRCSKVELGDFQFDFFKDVSSKIQSIASMVLPDGSLAAEKISGVINAAQTFIRGIRRSASAAHSVAILFEDRVEGSETYGALGIGTQGIIIADTWDDTIGEWKWTTACNAKGIIADTIVTGLIGNASAKNYWDLDADEIHFTFDSSEIISGAEAKDVADKLFDGSVEGFATKNGHFYISCTYMRGGSLELGGASNGDGTFTLNNSSGERIVYMDNKGFSLYDGNSHTSGSNTIKHDIATLSSRGFVLKDWWYTSSGWNSTEVLSITPSGGLQVGSRNGWGEEVIQLKDGIIYGRTENVNYSFIDVAAQYGNGIALVLRNNMDMYKGRVNLEGIILEANQTRIFDTYKNQIMTMDASCITAHVPTSWDSDISLKKNIVKAENNDDGLNALEVVSFDWKDGRGPGHVSAGLIAQEVKKVFPELVTESGKGVLGVNYVGLIPFLLAAYQRQNAQIKELYSMLTSKETR